VQFVSFVLDDAQQTWGKILPQEGQSWHDAKLVLFRDDVQSGRELQSERRGLPEADEQVPGPQRHGDHMLTRLRHRAQAARASGDAGVTLTELIVAMTLSTILGAMTLMVFLNVDKATSATTDRTINTSSARNAIQAWTSYLRVSDGPTAGSAVNRFEWITAGDIMFHANLYNRATSGAGLGSTTPSTMVWLRLDSAGALVEEQFPNTAAQGTNPSICRILVAKATAGGIANQVVHCLRQHRQPPDRPESGRGHRRRWRL